MEAVAVATTNQEVQKTQETSLEESINQSHRTVIYQYPEPAREEPAQEDATPDVSTLEGQGPNMSRAMQFLPQSGHRSETAWQFWYYQRQTPFYTQHQTQTIDGIIRVGPQPKVEKSPAETQSFRDQLKPLGKMPTIEHFFNYYVHMKKPSEMPREIDIHFFRDSLVPMWEDSPEGGIVILKIKKDDDIDKMWESILFAMIGEQFEEPKVIGASLSLRTKERLLQVWLRDGRNERVRTNVSNKIRHFLNLDPANVTLYYKEHIKSIKDGSTMKNAEGFKFMKAGAPRHNHTGSARGGPSSSHAYSQRSNQDGQQNSGRPQYKGQQNHPSFDHSNGSQHKGSARKLQPWSGLEAGAGDERRHNQKGGAPGCKRRPSDWRNQSGKPFQHLAASEGSSDSKGFYRPKAVSQV